MAAAETREIWPGAVVAAALISVTRGGLELYFEYLADFGALYGSLGALMALLIFVYAVSLILVFGAEYASEWSRLPTITIRKFAQASARAPMQRVSSPRTARPTITLRRGRGQREVGSPPLNNPGLRPRPPPSGAARR